MINVALMSCNLSDFPSISIFAESSIYYQFIKMSEQQKNLKRTNARVMKWREMLTKGLFTDMQLLIKRARKGIPKSMRIKVWPELIKIKNVMERKNMSYSKVLIKDSMDIYDINLDIPRTFSFQSQQILKESLFNVLRALSIQFPEIGYCQGMNFLTMRLLQVLDDDTTFYLMTYVLRKHQQVYDNFRNPGFVTRQNAVYLHLLRKFMPKTEAILNEHSLDPVLYTPSWFLTLFSKSLTEQKFYRFFECFLVEGYCFLFKMVLTMIKLKQKQIKQNSMEENLMFVPNMKFYEEIDDDLLIQTASSFEITNQQIYQLEAKYSVKNKKQIEKLQKSCKESYQKKINQPKRGFQWTMEDFNKVNANLISFDE